MKLRFDYCHSEPFTSFEGKLREESHDAQDEILSFGFAQSLPLTLERSEGEGTGLLRSSE